MINPFSLSCRRDTAESVADDGGSGRSKYKKRSNHDWLDREQKKNPKQNLKLESDQAVISNVSKLLAQKKKHLTLFLKSKSSHLTFKQEKQKSIPDDKNKTQKLSYIVKKDKSILQKEDL